MSDQVQAAAVSQPATLTVAQAAQKYAESKVANPVSDAARTLGQRGAEARAQARQAQASQPTEEVQQDDPENTAQATQGEEATTDEPLATEEANQDESLPETIDLGEGVSLTKSEIRENILRQADYTRKSQALAEKSKALDAERSQKLTLLDQAIGQLSKELGPEPDIELLASEDPADRRKYVEWQKKARQLGMAKSIAQRQQQEAVSAALAQRDQDLIESYNKDWADSAKRDKAYTELSAYGLKEGADPEELRQLTKPWMVRVLDKARQYDALQAGKSTVTKLVAGKPTVVRPGSKTSAQSAAASTIHTAQANLKATGSIASAVQLLQAQRALGRR